MKEYIYKSLALHIAVFVILMIDIPLFFWSRNNDMQSVPIIVDLKDVKISEMTNLPPKAKFDKEDKKAEMIKKKEEKTYTKEEEAAPQETTPKEIKEVPEETTEKTEEAPKEPKQDFLVAPQPKKPNTPTPPKKAEPVRPQPKKPQPPKSTAAKTDEKKPELVNPLKSLLASVGDMEKQLGEKDSEATIKEGTKVNNMGIEGGTGGSYFSELTISEMDALAGRLRACWNLDPGARGIEDMIIEVRAFLNQDGTVKDVKILNTSRYGSDAAYRSVADSARRAVYICAPYTILSEKYSSKYDKWKTMLIRFNPLDGSVK